MSIESFAQGALGLGALAGIGTDIANFGLQQENLNYQKNLQNKVFKREDTAIQRRVRDMKAAGINPILAAGQGANSGSTISTQAPQIGDAGEKISKMANVLALMGQKAEIEKTNMQTKLTEQQIENARSDNLNRLEDTKRRQLEYGARVRDLEILNKFGLLSNSTGMSMSVANLANVTYELIKSLGNGFIYGGSQLQQLKELPAQIQNQVADSIRAIANEIKNKGTVISDKTKDIVDQVKGEIKDKLVLSPSPQSLSDGMNEIQNAFQSLLESVIETPKEIQRKINQRR